MRATYAVLGAMLPVLLLAAGCGSEASGPGAAADPSADGTPSAPAPTERPTEVPAADGEVTTGHPVTVLDDGDGAELCLGAVATSLPPQCGGPKLVGWDWGDHRGHYEERSGTRWGDFVVTGTFDGKDVTPTEVVPAAVHDASPDVAHDDPWRTPCAEPEGGWEPVDPATTTQAALDEAVRLAHRLPGFGQLWVDQSINPVVDEEPSYEWELAMNDPRYTILNVSVTGSVEDAEAAIREVWGGPLCVSEARLTGREVRRIGDELGRLPGALTWGGESVPVEVSVVFDDGSFQAWADQEYGDGVVVISSALVPVTG